MHTKRRKINAPPAISIDLPDSDGDDPEYLELLKVYNEPDSDDDSDTETRLQKKRASSARSFVTQGSMYMLVLCGVGLFIIFLQYYNLKQLERLKVEYGLDDKKHEPEIWWKHGLIYHIYVQSFKDSDGDGIGDINGKNWCVYGELYRLSYNIAHFVDIYIYGHNGPL